MRIFTINSWLKWYVVEQVSDMENNEYENDLEFRRFQY